MQCFQVMLECQGVTKETAQELCHGDIWKVLPHVHENHVTKLFSPRKGIITDIDAMSVAMSCWKLGAGRSRADQDIDHRVGIRLLKTVGEEVDKEDPVLAVYHATQKLDQNIQQELEASITIQTTGLAKVSRIIEII
uniref:Pyrimidine nucleoside phosphorylase C-terminal domain-containing protein n=1 Tax=Timema tahoe TaxID=61484 RepID=A0A7R9ITS4_9NEOP|nr:unnamed protein product [Timema tahoe]